MAQQQIRDEVTRRVGFMRKYSPLVLSSLITSERFGVGYSARELVPEAIKVTEELCRQLEDWETKKLNEKEGRK